MPEVRTTVSKFEQVCRDSGLEPVKKIHVGERIVLIADGFANDGPNFKGPHYTTLWAVGKHEELMEVARPIYFEGLGKTTKEERVLLAEFEGTEFAKEYNLRCPLNPKK